MILAPSASFRGGGGGVVGISQFRWFLPFFLITRRFRNKESRIIFDPGGVDIHKPLLNISIRQTIFCCKIIDHVFMVFNQNTQQKISLGHIFVEEGSEGFSVRIGGGFREFRKVEPL